MLDGLVVSAELHITGPRKYRETLEASKYHDEPSFTDAPLASPVIIPMKVH
jgi:hypothetical protein